MLCMRRLKTVRGDDNELFRHLKLVFRYFSLHFFRGRREREEKVGESEKALFPKLRAINFNLENSSNYLKTFQEIVVKEN